MPRLPVRPIAALAALSSCALGLALLPGGAVAAPDRSAGPRAVQGPLVLEIATYADAVGPDKGLVIPRGPGGVTRGTGPGDSTPDYTTLVPDAHAAGLQVLPYTVRAENQFLPAELRSSTDPAAFGDVLTELGYLYRAGVDGVFADQPDLAVIARDGA